MPGPRKPLGKPIVKKQIQKPTPNRFIQTEKVKHEFELLKNLRTRLQQKRKQIEEINNSKLTEKKKEFELLENLRTRLQQKRKQIEEINNSKLTNKKKELALKIFRDQAELIKKQMGEAQKEMEKKNVAGKLFKEGVEKFTRKK
jgi:small-conductance mechanosensitive channel